MKKDNFSISVANGIIKATFEQVLSQEQSLHCPLQVSFLTFFKVFSQQDFFSVVLFSGLSFDFSSKVFLQQDFSTSILSVFFLHASNCLGNKKPPNSTISNNIRNFFVIQNTKRTYLKKSLQKLFFLHFSSKKVSFFHKKELSCIIINI